MFSLLPRICHRYIGDVSTKRPRRLSLSLEVSQRDLYSLSDDERALSQEASPHGRDRLYSIRYEWKCST